MAEIAIKSSDLLYLSLSTYEVPYPKAIVQIIPGEKDHKERYIEWIKWLNSNCLNVVVSDTRGHGKSISDEYPLGYMENIEQLIEDQKKVTEFIKNKYPGLDVYMFAQSFGATIARLYLQKYDMEIKKLVLSGPHFVDEGIGINLKIAKFITKMKKKSGFSKTLHEYVHLNNNDWYCSLPSVTESFNNDPLCQFDYRNQAIITMLNATKKLSNIKHFQNQNKDLKIYLVSGAQDIMTGGKLGLDNTIATLRKIGYSNIENQVYPNMKNAILLEYGKEKVYYDIIKFYLK